MVTISNNTLQGLAQQTEHLRSIEEQNQQLRKQVDCFEDQVLVLEEQLAGRDEVIESYQDWAQTGSVDVSKSLHPSHSAEYWVRYQSWVEKESTKTEEGDKGKTCEKGEARKHSRQLELGAGIRIPMNSPSPTNPSALPAQRIMSGTWVLEPETHVPIAEAESLIHKGKIQKALAHIDKHCPRNKTFPGNYINATLLKSCALRSVEDAQRALELAETALFVANLNQLPHLVAKAQFYRGLALLDLKLFAEAHHCLIRAASIQYYARDVEKLCLEAEQKRKALPLGTKGRVLGSGFEIIPREAGVSGFGAINS